MLKRDYAVYITICMTALMLLSVGMAEAQPLGHNYRNSRVAAGDLAEWTFDVGAIGAPSGTFTLIDGTEAFSGSDPALSFRAGEVLDRTFAFDFALSLAPGPDFYPLLHASDFSLSYAEDVLTATVFPAVGPTASASFEFETLPRNSVIGVHVFQLPGMIVLQLLVDGVMVDFESIFGELAVTSNTLLVGGVPLIGEISDLILTYEDIN